MNPNPSERIIFLPNIQSGTKEDRIREVENLIGGPTTRLTRRVPSWARLCCLDKEKISRRIRIDTWNLVELEHLVGDLVRHLGRSIQFKRLGEVL